MWQGARVFQVQALSSDHPFRPLRPPSRRRPTALADLSAAPSLAQAVGPSRQAKHLHLCFCKADLQPSHLFPLLAAPCLCLSPADRGLCLTRMRSRWALAALPLPLPLPLHLLAGSPQRHGIPHLNEVPTSSSLRSPMSTQVLLPAGENPLRRALKLEMCPIQLYVQEAAGFGCFRRYWKPQTFNFQACRSRVDSESGEIKWRRSHDGASVVLDT